MSLNDLAAATAKKNGVNKKAIKFCMLQLQRIIDVFNEAKEMIETEAKLVFQDFKKLFHLYTNVSDIQLGATLVRWQASEILYKKSQQRTTELYS